MHLDALCPSMFACQLSSHLCLSLLALAALRPHCCTLSRPLSRLRTAPLKRWQACRHTLAMTSSRDPTSRPLWHRASVSLERPFTLGPRRSTRQPQSAWQGPVLWAANRLTVLVCSNRDSRHPSLCGRPPQRASNSARLLSRMLHIRTNISLYLVSHLHSRGEGPSFDLPMVR